MRHRRRTSTSRAVSPAGHSRRPAHRMAGSDEHSRPPRRCRDLPALAITLAARAAASLAAHCWAKRPRLAHRPIRVDCYRDPCLPGDRLRREAPSDSRSRQGAPDAARRSRRAARGQRTGRASARSDGGAAARAPIRPTPSGPGLSQIAFETPQPTEVVDEAGPIQQAGPTRPAARVASAAEAASSATARACPSVYGDLRSTKSATASSAPSNSSPAARDAPAPVRPRSRPSHVWAESEVAENHLGIRAQRRRPAPGRTATRQRRSESATAASTPPTRSRPRRTRRIARAVPPRGIAVSPQFAGPALSRPTARTRSRPTPALPPAGRAAPPAPRREPRAGRSSRRGRDGRRSQTRGPPGNDAAVGCRCRRGASPQGGARTGSSWSCRTGGRCRPRTTSPARARRRGSRR